MSTWFGQLSSVAPPPGLAEWAVGQPTFDDAWRSAPRADWLVWLAAATARSDDEKREIVAGACLLAEKRGIVAHMFRLSPSALERAHLWASSNPLDDIDIVVADWFHGILFAAIIVVPLAVMMVLRATSGRAAIDLLVRPRIAHAQNRQPCARSSGERRPDVPITYGFGLGESNMIMHPLRRTRGLPRDAYRPSFDLRRVAAYCGGMLHPALRLPVVFS